ncbi:MAG: hypothetical protein H7833_09365 [Magnetococcus sp. DMHC-1]|nr:hypothetical protein [Magnetococcales bacterium]
MNPTYPYDLHEDPPGWYISFPDVPGSNTGDATRDDTIDGAMDCLITTMEAIMHQRQDIPPASLPNNGQGTVTLSPLVVAKLALYQTMRSHAMTNVALANALGIQESAVRRLLDLRHQSHIGQVDRALESLGKRLIVSVQDAA